MVLTKFIEDAREVEMDAVAKAGRVRTLLFFNIKLVFQDRRFAKMCGLNDLLYSHGFVLRRVEKQEKMNSS